MIVRALKKFARPLKNSNGNKGTIPMSMYGYWLDTLRVFDLIGEAAGGEPGDG